MKIVEQLAKQDEILEQIEWVRAIVSQKSVSGEKTTLVMDEYLDNVTDYAGFICGDSVSEEVAEEMRHLSLDGSSTTIRSFDPSEWEETPDSMTLVVGNTHRLVEPEPGTRNKHLWTFFLRASGLEIIPRGRGPPGKRLASQSWIGSTSTSTMPC